MKKLELKFDGMMLTKEQMKKISGGVAMTCYAVNADGSNGQGYGFSGDNCCATQAFADSVAYSNAYSSWFPYGVNCPCDCEDDQ